MLGESSIRLDWWANGWPPAQHDDASCVWVDFTVISMGPHPWTDRALLGKLPLNLVFLSISMLFMPEICTWFMDYRDTWKSRLCGICSRSHRSKSVLAGRGLASSRQAPHCPPTQAYLATCTHRHTDTTHTFKNMTWMHSNHAENDLVVTTLIMNNSPLTESGSEPHGSAIFDLSSVLYFCCSS